MMNKHLHLVVLALALGTTTIHAQNTVTDEYFNQRPGAYGVINGIPCDTALYNHFYGPNTGRTQPPYAARRARQQRLVKKGLAQPTQLPPYLYNNQLRYFPPIVNQSSGSCGNAAAVCHLMTYEWDNMRDLDASIESNQYPSHFGWLQSDQMTNLYTLVKDHGMPSVIDYGGRTYSRLFGPQEFDDNDYGWMQGYDHWYHAMFNRVEAFFSTEDSTKTADGRRELKEWLYNHCGDDRFHAGGVAVIGVAATDMSIKTIPSTDANIAAGVKGKHYIDAWGPSFNHALTVVGYDDRIEFDLDGNGVYGEADKDEVGAWLIANSWGNWQDKGFVYCPYKYSGALKKGNGSWTPELYAVRHDYRPLRVFKLKMDYSHRSEIMLSAGVSNDINATRPDVEQIFDHFHYSSNIKDLDPAPSVPMLGKWTDGYHYEPMEFGYDVTDLTAKMDRTRPIKYFFTITVKNPHVGSGNIYECSLMNYEQGPDAIELPFDDFVIDGIKRSADIPTPVTSTVTYTVVVPGDQTYPATNLQLADGLLSWQAPRTSTLPLLHYNIYEGTVLIDSVPATTTSYRPIDIDVTPFHVTAVYQVGRYTFESAASNTVTGAPVDLSETNLYFNTPDGGFTVPRAITEHMNDCTIEFWINPTNCRSWNMQMGPGWGKFLFHTTSSRDLVCGWNSTTGNRLEVAGAFTNKKWSHVAMVIHGNTLTAYVNGTKKKSITSTEYTGMPAIGDLAVGNWADSWQGGIDELRIWKTARTADQIKNSYKSEVAIPSAHQDLLIYLRMDTISRNGKTYLREIIQGKDATMHNDTQWDIKTESAIFRGLTTISGKIQAPATAVVGQPWQAHAITSTNIVDWQWQAPDATTPTFSGMNPSFIFTQPGTYTVRLDAIYTTAKTARDSVMVTVVNPAVPTADFRIAQPSLPMGTPFSFAAVPTGDDVTCTWIMEGADVEHATGINATATYSHEGTYDVTLRVTNASGTATKTRTVTVEPSAPDPDFAVRPYHIMLGDTVLLANLTRFQPDTYLWTITNGVHTYTQTDPDLYVIPGAPGCYDVTLQATNALGTNASTQPRALVVSNADAGNSLHFTGQEYLQADAFLPAAPHSFTLEWWMRPQETETSATLWHNLTAVIHTMLATRGVAVAVVAGGVYNSAEDYVIYDQWHHYAIAYSYNRVYFYRDGKLITSTAAASGTTNIDEAYWLPTFQFSSAGSGFAGFIDEFRFWDHKLSNDEMKAYFNAPIQDVATAQSAGLCLYYDFNHNSGDVIDRTTNHYDALRYGFGPDGDAWSDAIGVFTLDLDKAATETLVNYIHLTDIDDLATSGDTSSLTAAPLYDLLGRRVTPAYRGLVIRNGRLLLRR